MHKSATKYKETIGKWCKNKHGASKIIDTLETYHCSSLILQGSWSDHCNLRKKRKEKGTPPWYVKVGGHPMESVSHGLRKEKVGRIAKL
jgi:hypothetical protein